MQTLNGPFSSKIVTGLAQSEGSEPQNPQLAFLLDIFQWISTITNVVMESGYIRGVPKKVR